MVDDRQPGSLQCLSEFDGRRVASLGFELQRAHYNWIQDLRHVSRFGRGRNCSVEDLIDCRRIRLAVEQPPAYQRFPEHHARCVYVGAAIERLAEDLFGRHVSRFTLDLARARPRGARFGLGDSKIGDSRDAVQTDQQILRRDVAVNQSEGLPVVVTQFMSGVQTRECVDDNAKQQGFGDALVSGEQSTDPLGQAHPFDVLHYEVERVTIADLECADDVRMMNSGSEARFV